MGNLWESSFARCRETAGGALHDEYMFSIWPETAEPTVCFLHGERKFHSRVSNPAELTGAFAALAPQLPHVRLCDCTKTMSFYLVFFLFPLQSLTIWLQQQSLWNTKMGSHFKAHWRFRSREGTRQLETDTSPPSLLYPYNPSWTGSGLPLTKKIPAKEKSQKSFWGKGNAKKMGKNTACKNASCLL